MSPRPGPTFEIELAAPEIEVIKSKPLIDNSIAIIRKINKKVKINMITDFIKSSEIF
tara:strand:+ start:566 stop:736 length:171 start_codon:yes stop_codon:yes gene_type:complete